MERWGAAAGIGVQIQTMKECHSPGTTDEPICDIEDFAGETGPPGAAALGHSSAVFHKTTCTM